MLQMTNISGPSIVLASPRKQFYVTHMKDHNDKFRVLRAIILLRRAKCVGPARAIAEWKKRVL